MDNVSEKLGLYDFFNVISVGAIFILHIVFLFPDMLLKYNNWMKDGTIKFAGLFVLSYLFGLLLQEIGAFVDEKLTKVKKKRIRSFLTQEKIIDNSVKMEQYRKYAKDILKDKEIDFGENLTPEQNEYIYGYIEYYIEHKGRNRKFEKMRALYGMSKSLFYCMWVIGIIYIAGCWFSWNMYGFSAKYATYIILYVILSILIYYFRASRCMKYRIRMMMGVYESCIEAEKESFVK